MCRRMATASAAAGMRELLLSCAATDRATEEGAAASAGATQRVSRPSNTLRPLNLDSWMTAWKESPLEVPVEVG